MNGRLIFYLRFVLLLALILPAAPAQAATQSASEDEVLSTTTIWGDPDEAGNTIYTQLDVYDGYNWGSGVGTQLYLSRTVVSPEGEIVNSDENFFGSLFTTETVFQADPKFKSAVLSPVTFDDYYLPRQWTIQVNWDGIGTLATTRSAFKQASHDPVDQYQVKFDGDSVSREAIATGTLNGQSISNPSLYAIMKRYTSLAVSKGQAPYMISHPDYYAPTVELGNKQMRGGEGGIAEASWAVQNPDGTTTEIFLSVFDGYGYELRLRYFFEGTDIYLRRVVKDQDGNYLSYDFGSAYSAGPLIHIANNLDRAELLPVTITICSFMDRDMEGNCLGGEDVLIQAEWLGAGKLDKQSPFRFTEATNCDDADCWSTGFEHNFKVKVIGKGESRDATATGSLNGMDLGPSVVDDYGQSAYLYSIKEYTIEYGGTYPFPVFPIQVQ